jgi:glycosyltransferase involved in cell wall biosynthesis
MLRCLSGAKQPTEPPRISVVIPVFDELRNLSLLHSQLKEALSGLGNTYEIIFVDDGSLEGSTEFLRQLETSDSDTRLLEFVRNFGQTAAMAAGFDHA